MLEISEVMQNLSHHEFVVKNDADECTPGYYSHQSSVGLTNSWIRIFSKIKLRSQNQIGFEHVDEVEDNQSKSKKAKAESPPKQDSQRFSGRMFEIMPNNLFRTRSLLNNNFTCIISIVVL